MDLIILLLVAGIGIHYWVRTFRSSAAAKALNLFDYSVNGRWGLLEVFAIGFAWVSVQILVLTSAAWILGISAKELDKLPAAETALIGMISALAQIGLMLLALSYLVTKYRYRYSEFGLAAGEVATGIKQGLIGLAMWAPLVWIIQIILVNFISYSHPTMEEIRSSPELDVIAMSWFSAVVGAPIIEEIVFRVIIQGWLQRLRLGSAQSLDQLLMGDRPGQIEDMKKRRRKPVHFPAIGIASVLFGLVHFGQGPAPVTLFIFSLGLGYLYQRTGSLPACITMHAAFNAVTMAIFTLEIFTS